MWGIKLDLFSLNNVVMSIDDVVVVKLLKLQHVTQDIFSLCTQ